MKLLVTGGAGFIGSNFVRRALASDLNGILEHSQTWNLLRSRPGMNLFTGPSPTKVFFAT